MSSWSGKQLFSPHP